MRQFLILCLLCLSSSSCEMLQWAAPHQLWKLNRQPPIGGEDGYFSIPADSQDATSPFRTDQAAEPRSRQ